MDEKAVVDWVGRGEFLKILLKRSRKVTRWAAQEARWAAQEARSVKQEYRWDALDKGRSKFEFRAFIQLEVRRVLKLMERLAGVLSHFDLVIW